MGGVVRVGGLGVGVVGAASLGRYPSNRIKYK